MALPVGNISLEYLDHPADSPHLARAALYDAVTQFNTLVQHLRDGGQYQIGELKMMSYVPNPLPSGWLECNGSNISRTTYAALFALIGTRYGSQHETTFTLPNLRRRVPVGFGGPDGSPLTNEVGDTGGAETITLTEAQLPPHNHQSRLTISTIADHTHSPGDLTTNETGDHHHDGRVVTWPSGSGHTGLEPSLTRIFGGYPSDPDNRFRRNTESAGDHTHAVTGHTANTDSHDHTTTVSSVGGDTAHNNLQPSLVIYYMIYTGV